MGLLTLINQVDGLTIWTQEGTSDFYWPDPTKVGLWNGTTFAKNSSAVVADLPDHFHWHRYYIENQPLLFTSL